MRQITLTSRSLSMLAVAAFSLLAALQLTFSPFAAAIATTPQMEFFMDGSCPGNGPCVAHYAATFNPSGYAYRSWERCSPSDKTLYGGWHTGTGTYSSTPSCAASNSFAIQSGFNYDRTHKYSKQCWVSPDPLSGNC